jgi:hypothetical protein
MMPIRFDPENDLEPTSFDESLCHLALEMKRRGLPWRPHVGCFVWDPDSHIQPDSPFPNRVYFILSLPRFIDIFGSIQSITEKLVWLPTWHQARLICRRLGVDEESVAADRKPGEITDPSKELAALYAALIKRLKR